MRPGTNELAPPHSSAVRRWGAWVFGLLCLGAVIALIGHLGEIKRFADLLEAAEPLWFLAGVALQALTYVAAAMVWYTALRQAGMRRPLPTLIRLSLAKLFSDQAMPTAGISGTLVLLRGFIRRGVPQPVATAVMLVSLVTYYCAYLIATLLSLVVLGRHHLLSAVLAAVLGVFAIVAVGTPLFAILFLGPISHRLRDYAGRFPGLKLLGETDTQLLSRLLRRPGLVAATTGFNLIVFLIDAATLYLMLRAIGVHAPPLEVFASFVVASVVATLGPMPLGLGAFEGTAVAMLRLSGVDLEPGLTATLLLRGLTVWVPMLPGLWIARRELRDR
jgi:uncharacterized membrane protein YbhN (UPF0104 family)